MFIVFPVNPIIREPDLVVKNKNAKNQGFSGFFASPLLAEPVNTVFPALCLLTT
jgi:hypothetical protein